MIHEDQRDRELCDSVAIFSEGHYKDKNHLDKLGDGGNVNTLRTGDADLRFYITTVRDG